MYRYIPNRESTRARRLACFLFAVSLVLFALSGLRELPYKWAVQLLSFALITAAIMIAVRYLFRGYCYMIEVNDGSVDFDVYELSRRGSVVVCRLALSSLQSVTPAAEWKGERGQRLYNYCVDIGPKNAVVLGFDDEAVEGRVYIKIQCDESFLSHIREESGKAL